MYAGNSSYRHVPRMARVPSLLLVGLAATAVMCLPACIGDACGDGSICADGDACTVDVCTVDDAASGGFVCAYTPSDCASNGLICNPANGVCVECLTLLDCGDGLFCNGIETCSADLSCAGGAAPCPEPPDACSEGTDTCADPCTGSGDCPDDGLFCNGTEFCSPSGVCRHGGDPCAVRPATPVCDEGGDACVECLTAEDCAPAQDACVNYLCVVVVECNSNGDCPSDGVFCNGQEYCDTSGVLGICASAGDPCAALAGGCSASDFVCNEMAEACDEINAPSPIPLTDQIDIINATFDPPTTAFNDTLIATSTTYNTGDQVDGLGCDDRLNLILVDAEIDLVDLTSVERIYIRNTFDGQVLDAGGWRGYTQIWYDRGVEDLTVTNLRAPATIGIAEGAGANLDFTVEFDRSIVGGGDDTLHLALDRANAHNFTAGGGGEGFETIHIDLTGVNEINGIASVGAENVVITGAGTLELGTPVAGASVVDASAATGVIRMPLADDGVRARGGKANDTFTAGAGEDVFVIAATAVENGTDTIIGFDRNDAIDVSAFAADDDISATLPDTSIHGRVAADGDIFLVIDDDSSTDIAEEIAALFSAGEAVPFIPSAGAHVVLVIRSQTRVDTYVWYVDNDATAAVVPAECKRVATLSDYVGVIGDEQINP